MRKWLFIVFFALFASYLGAQENERVLSLEEFIRLATMNDTNFEEILINELTLTYKKAIALPAKDLVLSVKGEFDFLFDPTENDFSSSVGLSKLFPFSGTEFSAEYTTVIASGTRETTSGFTAYVSQPIAENAFGRNTRLLDAITGIEIDVARFQIVEAYEDYLAKLIDTYYEWYSAYENLKTAQNSYNENIKLLENIQEREKHKIALPVDVNKVRLQVTAKKESLILIESNYTEYENKIIEAIRYEGTATLVPGASSLYDNLSINFDTDYLIFEEQSRTSQTLRLLEEQSSLEVNKYADELLPSINVYAGFSVEGSGRVLEDSEQLLYTGIRLDWPFPSQVERAEYETAKIVRKKTSLSTVNTHLRLYTEIRNLYIQIQEEKKLIAVAGEKIELAQAILKDDKENYSLGKLSLNDLIDEVNVLENNKFNKIYHTIQLRKLIIEWLRLTDKLVTENILQEKKGETNEDF